MESKNETQREDVRTVSLPEHLVTQVEGRLARTDFDSPEEYIAYVLEEVLVRVDDATEDANYESVDEDEVKSRLESLGYIDS